MERMVKKIARVLIPARNDRIWFEILIASTFEKVGLP
jgi:hypothetical protein